jgi:hypothetical protein
MDYNALRQAYLKPSLPSIQLGAMTVDDRLLSDAAVHIALQSLNRHGLIAGATGSGKTKTIQSMCEQLSLNGVPCLVMDIKGDISGLAEKGAHNEALVARNQSMQLPFEPRAFPCELLTLDDQDIGIPMRTTIESLGSLLLSRMLGVNDTQAGIVTILFEYAKKNNMPLLDLADLKSLLQFSQTEQGKAVIQQQYGSVSSTSIGAILRKIIELEAQNAQSFFGEPAFLVEDVLRCNADAKGIISIIRLMDMQDKPQLFSSFMLKLLTDLYRDLPEVGDAQKPKLLLFIDEAHLMFKQASSALLSLVETMVKLIRSKGVGLIFCTQTPNDIPDSILSQLGLKVQHALRAFTAKDRKAMRLVAQNFPPSDIYNTERLLTSLGIGEALVCALNAKGVPMPLVACRIRAPESRMGVLSAQEASSLVQASPLQHKYGVRVERTSASELLQQSSPQEATISKTSKPSDTQARSLWSRLTKNTLFRQLARQFLRQITQAVLAIFIVKKSTKTSRRKPRSRKK